MTSRYLPRILFLLLISFFFSVAAADDGAAILALAKSLRPLPSGWSTTSSVGFCYWSGISCDPGGCVISIMLADQSLSGELPPNISSLSKLQILILSRNFLSGKIPSFTKLSSLQLMYLNDNLFDGIANKAFSGLKNLQILNMRHNKNLIEWTFPKELAKLKFLTTINFDNTSLSGTLPDVFDSFASLQYLKLSYNNLTGPLPPSLAKSSIQKLWINNQYLGMSGTIDVLSGMTNLSQAWLHKNQFTGPIPNSFKSNSLFDLKLHDNKFTGIVPPTLTSLKSLLFVSLDNNKLQGQMPSFAIGVTNSFEHNNFCTLKVGVTCDPQVTILLDVIGAFGFPEMLADYWQGNDACDNWPYVTCDSTRKVVALNLGKRGFSGILSPAIVNLNSLKTLYLNDNNLTGSIPLAMKFMANLELVDVSNNNFSGEKPEFAASVKFNYKPGNDLLELGSGGEGLSGESGGDIFSGKTDGYSNSHKPVGVIIVLVLPVLVFLNIACFVVFKFTTGAFRDRGGRYVNRCASNNLNGLNNLSSCNNKESENATISMEVLRQATDNFKKDNIMDRGGFGIVYKGELHDGTKIVVKKMESVTMGTMKMNEFHSEIDALKVKHKHVVALLGFCINENETLFVYEYMPPRTLRQHLFEWRELGYAPLTWKQRVTIALDVARGVEYLHSLAQQRLIHKDLKSSNIFLGDDLRAKIADFGLVKNVLDGKYSVETRLIGTFGYLAPEYAATGKVTTEVDVYAFGVVLMEMITGRKRIEKRE